MEQYKDNPRDDFKFELMEAINEEIASVGSSMSMREISSLTGGRLSLSTISRIRNYECDLLKIDTLIEAWSYVRLFVTKREPSLSIAIIT